MARYTKRRRTYRTKETSPTTPHRSTSLGQPSSSAATPPPSTTAPSPSSTPSPSSMPSLSTAHPPPSSGQPSSSTATPPHPTNAPSPFSTPSPSSTHSPSSVPSPRSGTSLSTPQPLPSSAPPSSSAATPRPTSRTSSTIRRGRAYGQRNWRDEDTNAFLEILELVRPKNDESWDRVHEQMEAWSCENGFPTRSVSALQTRFQKLIKGAPTGGGEFSHRQKKARAILAMMADDVSASYLVEDDVEAEDNIAEQVARAEQTETNRTNLVGRQALTNLLDVAGSSEDSSDVSMRRAQRSRKRTRGRNGTSTSELAMVMQQCQQQFMLMMQQMQNQQMQAEQRHEAMLAAILGGRNAEAQLRRDPQDQDSQSESFEEM